MKENETKTCPYPKCNKERAPKRFFCLEHSAFLTRDVPDRIKNGAVITGTVAVAVIGAVTQIKIANSQNKKAGK